MTSAVEEAVLGVIRDAMAHPRERRCGVEVELIVYSGDPPTRAPYWGDRGVRLLLERLVQCGGEVSDRDGEVIKKLTVPEGMVSLEHGAQLEFAGHPHASLWDLAAEWRRFLDRLDAAREGLSGVRLLTVGFDPLTTDAAYERPGDAMTLPYLRARSPAAALMALHTAAVHVSLDYGESDFVEMFRAAVAIAPHVAALFANSPFVEGRRADVESVRALTWLDAERVRCHPSLLHAFAAAAEPADAFAAHVARLPLIFWKEGGSWIAAEGRTLADLAGPGAPSPQQARVAMKQCWTQVRLKEILELRGMDTVPPDLAIAAAALWCGLLYDERSRRRATELCAAASEGEYLDRWERAAREGVWGNPPLLARLVALAAEGLDRRGAGGRPESDLLDPLRAWLDRPRPGAPGPAELVAAHSF